MEKELDFTKPEYYQNRELSWLKFEHRILNEARDKSIPLLERLKFAAIVSSNLDEFFMVRVASLKDMVDNNYFSHNSPTYGTPFNMIKNFGIKYKAAGENIAGNSTLEGAVNAWMNSQGHRENILNNAYNLTGIGVVKSNTYGYVMVQMFVGR